MLVDDLGRRSRAEPERSRPISWLALRRRGRCGRSTMSQAPVMALRLRRRERCEIRDATTTPPFLEPFPWFYRLG